MWWVVVFAGLTFQFADHVVNQMSYRYFSSRAEYLICLQGTMGPRGLTIDDYEINEMAWATYNSAALRAEQACEGIPGVVAVLHPHLPRWQARIWPSEDGDGQGGGAFSNCSMSPQDVGMWRKSTLPFSVIQCGMFAWAMFAWVQLETWENGPLDPWVILSLLEDAEPERR